jgi:hypothetical protein
MLLGPRSPKRIGRLRPSISAPFAQQPRTPEPPGTAPQPAPDPTAPPPYEMDPSPPPSASPSSCSTSSRAWWVRSPLVDTTHPITRYTPESSSPRSGPAPGDRQCEGRTRFTSMSTCHQAPSPRPAGQWQFLATEPPKTKISALTSPPRWRRTGSRLSPSTPSGTVSARLARSWSTKPSARE